MSPKRGPESEESLVPMAGPNWDTAEPYTLVEASAVKCSSSVIRGMELDMMRWKMRSVDERVDFEPLSEPNVTSINFISKFSHAWI